MSVVQFWKNESMEVKTGKQISYQWNFCENIRDPILGMRGFEKLAGSLVGLNSPKKQ